jgi:hypothetical protein
MGLADTIRNAIATANAITSDLQVTVRHRAWTGTDAYSKPVYATAIHRPAIVDFRQRLRRDLNGQEVVQVASVMFLEPILPNGATGRREPVDPRDELTLPNGYTGPIIDVGGFVDAGTDAPFLIEIGLG